MRKKKEVNKPFDGGFDVKAMVEALSTIEDERSISQEETLEILRQSFEKGYKDFVDPNNADDLLAEATLDLKGGKIHFFDIKNVVEDVQDDLVEIELDEAREIDPNIQIGDQLKTEVDITTLGDPSLLIRKVANTFKQKMIEANKKALLEKFNSQIGHLISGEVEKVEKELEHAELIEEVSDVPCEKCGRMMVIKYGRYGKFLACPGYPECKNAKPIIETIDVPCPVCGGTVQIKKTRRGKKFYVCENNPGTCEYISWNPPKPGEPWTPEKKEEKKKKTTKTKKAKTTKRKTKK